MTIKIEDFNIERFNMHIPNRTAVALVPYTQHVEGWEVKHLITNIQGNTSYAVFSIFTGNNGAVMVNGYLVDLVDSIIERDKQQIFKENKGKKSRSKYANLMNILLYYKNIPNNKIVTPLTKVHKFTGKDYTYAIENETVKFKTVYDMCVFFDTEFKIKYMEHTFKKVPNYFRKVIRDYKYAKDVLVIKDSFYDSGCSGVTYRSLDFFKIVKLLVSPSDVVKVEWGEDATGNFQFTLILKNAKRLVFTGFGGGYRGTGSRGAYTVLQYFQLPNAELIFEEEKLQMAR